MDAQFWIKSWKEGRTAFHQEKFHEKLLQYFPAFLPQKGQKVLVPLCGKTRDLLWLHQQGLQVHGVELYEDAVKACFAENGLPAPQMAQDPDFICYSSENILLRCGDFFKLPETETYDFIYDRASLVALPPAMRKNYAEVIHRALKRGGKCLLIVYEYDPGKMEGPPFSIQDKEIHQLYGDRFSIELLESGNPNHEGSRLSTVSGLQQKIYSLEKI